MKLYSFKGEAKVVLCVMSTVRAYHNPGRRYAFSILRENPMYLGMLFLSGSAVHPLSQAV